MMLTVFNDHVLLVSTWRDTGTAGIHILGITFCDKVARIMGDMRFL